MAFFAMNKKTIPAWENRHFYKAHGGPFRSETEKEPGEQLQGHSCPSACARDDPPPELVAEG